MALIEPLAALALGVPEPLDVLERLTQVPAGDDEVGLTAPLFPRLRQGLLFPGALLLPRDDASELIHRHDAGIGHDDPQVVQFVHQLFPLVLGFGEVPLGNREPEVGH